MVAAWMERVRGTTADDVRVASGGMLCRTTVQDMSRHVHVSAANFSQVADKLRATSVWMHMHGASR